MFAVSVIITAGFMWRLTVANDCLFSFVKSVSEKQNFFVFFRKKETCENSYIKTVL